MPIRSPILFQNKLFSASSNASISSVEISKTVSDIDVELDNIINNFDAKKLKELLFRIDNSYLISKDRSFNILKLSREEGNFKV